MPFKSEKQRRYMHANEPAIADEWENHGGIYPAPENFNPGGGDAVVQGNTRAPYGDEYRVDGADESNPFRAGGVQDDGPDSLIY